MGFNSAFKGLRTATIVKEIKNARNANVPPFYSIRLSHSIHAKFREIRFKQHTPFHFTAHCRPVFRRFRLIPSSNKIKKMNEITGDSDGDIFQL
jgi:hypothetical protein